MLKLYDLSVNAIKNPTFVPCEGLYIGWKLNSDRTDVIQRSYIARIYLDDKNQHTVPVWEQKGTSQSVHVVVDTHLKSRSDYILTITVEDNYGETATESIRFGTAIAQHEWMGQWIKPQKHIEGWAPYLRTKFVVCDEVKAAKLYICGLGCGEYYLNGRKISEDMIDPPFTNYEREVLYRIYDVTDFIQPQNALAALLGEGWYSQSRAWNYRGFKYGDVCLLAQLEIEYEDGTKQIVSTDTEHWQYKYSPIVLNNLYAGEMYDARLETPDYSDNFGDDDGWGRVVEDTVPRGELKLCMMPAIHTVRSIPAVSVRKVSGKSDGAWIVDFGENVAGIVEIHIPRSPSGAQYVLRFAETVNPDGTLDYRSVGTFATNCLQQDVYIAKGDPQGETWKPKFTYHGFRYMEITGYCDPRTFDMLPDPSIAVCHVIATDLTQTGRFTCDHQDLNRLQTIMMSTFLSNYHGFPEDCPAREKCGWLGDAQVVCNTGIMNYDLESSYEKYIHDIRTTDEVYGGWRMISPGKRGCGGASPLWGCANVVMPYWMYRYYGNETIVRNHWDQMEKWMRHEMDDAAQATGDYIITRGLGDWCPPVGKFSPRRIPVQESSTAIFYETAIMMDELSKQLNLTSSLDYCELATMIKDSFNRHFWNQDKHCYSTWGTCGVALKTGLYPDGEHDALVNALVNMIKDDDYEMSTGIYGNKYLLPVLFEEGYGDVAMKIMFTREHTSFGTMLDDDATSLWECLEMKNIGMPYEVSTSSYNHPMHSGFAYCLYSDIGGITPLSPGFADFEIRPAYFTDISGAEVIHICPYGEIKVSWKREAAETHYTITVPANTVGYFRLGDIEKKMGSGIHALIVSH